MSRRERLERRAALRQEWAEKRHAKAEAACNRAHSLTDGIPFGQPILVGHHSEKRHRRTLDKADNAMRAAVENERAAKDHEGKAAGLAAHLERSIFSDDDNAAEACEARAAEFDADAERWKALQSAWRKHKDKEPAARLSAMIEAGIITKDEAMKAAHTYALMPYHGTPWPSYHLTNLRAQARRYRERAKAIRAHEARRAEAEAAPGGVLIRYSDDKTQANVTFPDYPGRSTVADLKAAGFWWNRPSWWGPADKLPACVLEMVEDAANGAQS